MYVHAECVWVFFLAAMHAPPFQLCFYSLAISIEHDLNSYRIVMNFLPFMYNIPKCAHRIMHVWNHCLGGGALCSISFLEVVVENLV